jgi:hypothetical protein
MAFSDMTLALFCECPALHVNAIPQTSTAHYRHQTRTLPAMTRAKQIPLNSDIKFGPGTSQRQEPDAIGAPLVSERTRSLVRG